MQRLFVVMALMLIVTACTGNPPSTIAFTELPDSGDSAIGEILFTGQNCSNCHMEGATGAPQLDGLSDRAGSTVEGQSAREYVFYSITEPAQHIVEGFGNAMPNDYDENMTATELADLIAYLLSL